jgi:hypothetical protein
LPGSGNNLANELRDIAAASASTYHLGFVPDIPPDNRYHGIAVKVASRPDLTLRHRTGFLYERESASLRERFRKAIWEPMDATEIGVTAASDSSAEGPALKLTIAASDLAFDEESGVYTGKIDIFIARRNDETSQSQVSGRTVVLHLKPDVYRAYLKDGIPFDQPLTSAAQSGSTTGSQAGTSYSSLRIVVADENSGRMGTVTIPASILNR